MQADSVKFAGFDAERQDVFARRQRADREVGEAAGRRKGAVEIKGDFAAGHVFADQEPRGWVGFAARGGVADHEHRFARLPMGSKQGDGVAVVGEGCGVGQLNRGGAAALIADVSTVFKVHMVTGMSLFIIFPFTRLVHVWSGFGSVGYLARPWQVVRSRKIGLSE